MAVLSLLVLLSLVVVCWYSLSRPVIGVTAYYLLTLLGPQYIWWWAFEGLRVSLVVVAFTFMGVALSASKKEYDYTFLLNRTNYFVFTLWLAIFISYYFGPYVNDDNMSHLSPDFVFKISTTICLFYLVASVEVNDVRKLRYLAVIICLSVAYLAYWANVQYFSGNWYQFRFGRLMGPTSLDGSSIYNDTNNFAMFFVTCLPFLYYAAFELKNIILRWFLWAVIPFAVHAIFLTGSRGGLVGIGVVSLCILYFSKRKVLVVPVLVLLFVFYQWQAGDVMKERSSQIVNIEGEDSAGDRLVAWQGGLRMLLDHPFTGVGVGSFETALPDYIESRHMVAHNTLVQFAAESGLMAGVSYLCIIVFFIMQAFRIRTYCRQHPDDERVKKIDLYNNASAASFSGLVVCSMFLSLNTSELIFLLLLFNNAIFQVVNSDTTMKKDGKPISRVDIINEKLNKKSC